MTKNSLSNLQKKVRHYAPEALVGICALSIVALTVAAKKSNTFSFDHDGFAMEMNRDHLKRMRETGDGILFSTGEFGDFLITALPIHEI